MTFRFTFPPGAVFYGFDKDLYSASAMMLRGRQELAGVACFVEVYTIETGWRPHTESN